MDYLIPPDCRTIRDTDTAAAPAGTSHQRTMWSVLAFFPSLTRPFLRSPVGSSWCFANAHHNRPAVGAVAAPSERGDEETLPGRVSREASVSTPSMQFPRRIPS